MTISPGISGSFIPKTGASVYSQRQSEEIVDGSRTSQNEQAMKALKDRVSKLEFGKKFILLAEEQIIEPRELVLYEGNSKRFSLANLLLNSSIFKHVDGNPEARRARIKDLSASEKSGIQRLVADITNASLENPLSTKNLGFDFGEYAERHYGLSKEGVLQSRGS